ncbi:MAG: hypothetical protein AAF721_15750 [Myxococcota bacterium]
MKPPTLLFTALLALGCGHADRPVAALASEPADCPAVTPAEDPEEIEFERNGCPSGVDASAACLEEDIGQCCFIAAIKEEYEMLEARENGDQVSEARYADQLERLLQRGCDLDDVKACEQL